MLQLFHKFLFPKSIENRMQNHGTLPLDTSACLSQEQVNCFHNQLLHCLGFIVKKGKRIWGTLVESMNTKSMLSCLRLSPNSLVVFLFVFLFWSKVQSASCLTCVHTKSLPLCLTLRPYGQQPARFLRPWDSPGKNTGGGGHALLQGIFPTQRLNHIFYVSCTGRQVLYH